MCTACKSDHQAIVQPRWAMYTQRVHPHRAVTARRGNAARRSAQSGSSRGGGRERAHSVSEVRARPCRGTHHVGRWTLPPDVGTFGADAGWFGPGGAGPQCSCEVRRLECRSVEKQL
jgi:hypothetical protein